MNDRLRAEVAQAERRSGALSLLLLDVDHFKSVNDTYGHPAGDAVLREVCERVGSRLRGVDMLARYGGDEFAVVLHGIGNAIARTVADRIVALVGDQSVAIDANSIPVRISIGVGSLDETSRHSADELVGLADQRLYSAKAAGRSQVVSS